MRVEIGPIAFQVHRWSPGRPEGGVLFLHGMAGTGMDWEAAAAALPHSDRVAPDLMGHGESDTPYDRVVYTYAGAADLFLSLCQSLRLVRPVVVGYSMGARLALALALRHPERLGGAFLVSCHSGLDGQERRTRVERDEGLARLAEEQGAAAFFQEWHRAPVFDTRRQGPGWAEEVSRKLRTNRAAGIARCLRGFGLGHWEPPPEGWRPPFPVQLVCGAVDEAYVDHARRLKQRIPAAGVITIAGSGHAPQWERPAAFGQVLRSFVESSLKTNRG